jgi:hypothetical protein
MLKYAVLAAAVLASGTADARAKPWAYKAGVLVSNAGSGPYSICDTIADLDRFLGLAKLRAVEAMAQYSNCIISTRPLTAVVLESSGDYVRAMSTTDDGSTRELWFYRGHLRSRKDYQAEACRLAAVDKGALGQQCYPDRESWTE